MRDRERLAAQIHETARHLAQGGVVNDQHVLVSAVVEAILAVKKGQDDE